MEIDHNWFKENLIKNYNKNLHNVLKNDVIVSSLLKIKFNNSEVRTLSKRFGFKFNYDEMINWNFENSSYNNIINSYLDKEGFMTKLFLEDVDYTFESHEAPLNLDQLYIKFWGTLMDLNEHYKNDEIDFYLFYFTDLSHYADNKTLIKNTNSVMFKSKISNIKDIRKVYKNKVLPLTMNENFYGKRSYSTRTYIDEENGVERRITNISKHEIKKDVYSIKSGALLESFIDIKLSENSFLRKNQKTNSSIKVENNKIIRTTVKTLLPIININENKYKNTFNKNIGSFDIETFYNMSKQRQDVYALGFSYGGNNVMLIEPATKMFYRDKGKTSEEIVLQCINCMLSTKYKSAIFYTHNLGGYDVFFILKINPYIHFKYIAT